MVGQPILSPIHHAQSIAMRDTALGVFLSILDFGHVPEPTLHLGLGQPQKTSLLHLQDSMVNTGALAILLKDSHPQTPVFYFAWITEPSKDPCFV